MLPTCHHDAKMRVAGLPKSLTELAACDVGASELA